MLDCQWCGGTGWIGINNVCGECSGSGDANEYYDSEWGWTKTKTKKILFRIPENMSLSDFVVGTDDQDDGIPC